MTTEDQQKFLQSLLAHWNEIAIGLANTQKTISLVSGQVGGLAIAINRLIRLMAVAVLLTIVAVFIALVCMSYALDREATANEIHRHQEQLKNTDMREEIWGVIRLLTVKKCSETLSGTTSETGN